VVLVGGISIDTTLQSAWLARGIKLVVTQISSNSQVCLVALHNWTGHRYELEMGRQAEFSDF
jgi:hypothetical protein